MEATPQSEEGRRGNPRQNGRKRQFQGGRGPKRQRTRKEKPIQEGSRDDVLLADVRALFAAQKLSETMVAPVPADEPPPEPVKGYANETSESIGVGITSQAERSSDDIEKRPSGLPEPFTEIEVNVVEISSTGDGLALHPNSKQIYVVPFTSPGDVVKAKVIRHYEDDHYSHADFVSIIQPGPLRDDSRVKCKYFTVCSGCQFQMLDYQTQLNHKKTIVEKAYKNFSDLLPELVPKVEDTIGSPLQYGYRTKLTPHFDTPPGYVSKKDKM